MRSGSTGVGSIDAGLGRGDADGAGHAASLLVGLAVGLRARGDRERRTEPSPWGGREGGDGSGCRPCGGDGKREKKSESGSEI